MLYLIEFNWTHFYLGSLESTTISGPVGENRTVVNLSPFLYFFQCIDFILTFFQCVKAIMSPTLQQEDATSIFHC